MTNNRECSVYLCLFYVTGVHDPVVSRTKMSMLGVGLYWRYHDVSPSRYQKFRQSCRPASILL